MERRAAKLDPAFRRQLSLYLESIMNLVYLAQVKAEEGSESKRYLRLADERIKELAKLIHES
jgi:hypothetical protein